MRLIVQTIGLILITGILVGCNREQIKTTCSGNLKQSSSIEQDSGYPLHKRFREVKPTMISGVLDNVLGQAPTDEPPVLFEPELTTRGWQQRWAYYKDLQVNHDRLYLMGPFERYGGEDKEFRTWSLEDATATVICPAAFLANVLALPIDMVISPPGKGSTPHN